MLKVKRKIHPSEGQGYLHENLAIFEGTDDSERLAQFSLAEITAARADGKRFKVWDDDRLFSLTKTQLNQARKHLGMEPLA